MKIDIHHHCIPRRLIDLVRRDPKRYQSLVYRDPGTGLEALAPGLTSPPKVAGPGRSVYAMDPGIYDLSVHIEEMEAMGLDMAALSVSPLLFYYSAEAALATEVAQICNDAIHDAAQKYPQQFVGMGTVPLQDVQAAISELERVVREYGFTAVEIGGSVNGRNFDEPEFEPFFSRAAELDVLLFVHPSGAPAPERLPRYYTSNTIGLPVESGICAASLIFGGTLQRYPNIKICFAHGGGIVPGLIGRWDHGWEVRAEAKAVIDRPPSTYFAQLYFDDLVHSDAVLRALLDISSAERVVLGTDYPYDMGERNPGAVLQRQNLPPEQRRMIESETAISLLRIPLSIVRE